MQQSVTALRLFRTAAALALVLALAAGAALALEHTWAGVERIVAVGDVHGDHEQFVAVLRAAKVIDDKGDWIAGKTHLVQLGDVLDRWADSRKAMDLLMKLEEQAGRAGGRVHALLGNHEAMVLLGDWRYVHPGEFMAFGGEEGFRTAMSADGKYGQWILGHNTVIKINDILFVHAGLVGEFARMSRDELNDGVRKQLREGKPLEGGVAMHGSGPLWYRGLALADEEKLTEDIDELMEAHKVERIVIGHTFAPGGIRVRAGGRVIVIDVGISRYYKRLGGQPACLVIEKGKFLEVRPDKEPQPLKLPASEEAVPAP